MLREVIFGIIGGLGLFIYGIHIMGEGLQGTAGARLRRILQTITKNPLAGIFTGACTTAIIQSSSATTVMAVGFVNAGLLSFLNSIGVVMGANIGTTVTAQIIAFRVNEYALPAIGIGLALSLFGRRRIIKNVGRTLLGFGILFLGLTIMTDTTRFLGESEAVKGIFINMSRNPLLGVLAGMVVTMLIQSSSATIGLTMALAMGGLVDLYGAIALVLGDNIGTCITAALASIGGSVSAKRTAVAHVLFNATGVFVFLSALSLYTELIRHTAVSIGRQVANAHLFFNCINTIVFFPFIRPFSELVKKIVPGKEVFDEAGPKFLERHLLNTPSVAIQQARLELARMAGITRGMVRDGMNCFFENKPVPGKFSQTEEMVDGLQHDITEYLVELSRRRLDEEESEAIPALMHAVNDIERIGDLSENLVEAAERRQAERLAFSEDAIKEVRDMFTGIDEMTAQAINALQENDARIGRTVWEKESLINELAIKLRENHIQRLRTGKCFVISGVVFLNVVSNLEKIGDHLNNVADAVCGALQMGE